MGKFPFVRNSRRGCPRKFFLRWSSHSRRKFSRSRRTCASSRTS